MKEIEFLNPKFLRYFRVISETGSFLSASKKLNVSQPALTRAIKLLEFNLKKKLFLRGKKGITLTEEGKLLLDYSKNNSQANLKIKSLIQNYKKDLKEEKNEFITIGIPPTLASLFKENFIWFVKQNFSNSRIKVIDENSFNLIQSVQEKKIDFAISTLPSDNPKIDEFFLMSDRFGVAFHQNHFFKDKKQIELSLVQQQNDYVFRDHCEFFFYKEKLTQNKNISYSEYKEIIKKRKFEKGFKDVIYTDNEITSSICIKQGLGVGVIPESIARNNRLSFRYFTDKRLQREIYFIRGLNSKPLNFNPEILKNLFLN